MANDVFCRRIAKLCNVMVVVVAVGYRLPSENRYPLKVVFFLLFLVLLLLHVAVVVRPLLH